MKKLVWAHWAEFLTARIELHLQERLTVLHRELDGLAAQAAREREDRMRGLQLAARSLRQAESTVQWVQILADAASPLADAVSFHRVDAKFFHCEAARRMDLVPQAVPLVDAPAFQQAVDTRETVVCLFSASQVSAAVAGETPSRRRAHLFPLVGKTRVLGILLALDGPALDLSGIEVLLSLAAASLEMRESKSAALIAAAPSIPAATPVTARSFARATIASWLLDHGDVIATGRAAKNLRTALQVQIDAAKREFAVRFPAAPDYLHEEILERLALGKVELLGPAKSGGHGA